MTASIWFKDKAALTTEDDLPSRQTNDDAAAAPYTWLDDHSAADNSASQEDGTGFVDVEVDLVPTLYDVYEQTFVFNPGDARDDAQNNKAALMEVDDDLPEVQALYSAFAVAPDAATAVKAEAPLAEPHLDDEATLADQHSDSNQLPMHSMEEVFNQVRRDPVLLQRAILVVACTFLMIAAAALWRAIGDKVVATELVPPLVYASIGVVAYLLGMRYLRIHFAQVRVGDKDWLLCEQVMVAADNGVMLKARFGTAYLIWEQLLGVAQDGDYYYLLIEPSQGFKVPKQGVSDPGLQVKLDDLASLTRAEALQGSRS